VDEDGGNHCGFRLSSAGRRGRQLRRYRDTGPDTLLPLNNDALARLHAFINDGEPLAAGAEPKAALLYFIVLATTKT
jgi:hypothetical protein